MKQDILINLLADKNIFEKLVQEFPGLYSACVNIKQNVSSAIVKKACEKIINFYNTNDKFKLFIDSNTNTNAAIKVENTSVGNDVSGMIVVIDTMEESYKKLMETAKKEKWQYKGIAIVADFKNIRLYFY
jgi:hypothetical protein